MTEYIWATDAFNHAIQTYPQECCGLIIDMNGIETYWICKNISSTYKEKSFVIDPLDYARGEDQGEVLGIVHSHPDGEFSAKLYQEQRFSICETLGMLSNGHCIFKRRGFQCFL